VHFVDSLGEKALHWIDRLGAAFVAQNAYGVRPKRATGIAPADRGQERYAEAQGEEQGAGPTSSFPHFPAAVFQGEEPALRISAARRTATEKRSLSRVAVEASASSIPFSLLFEKGATDSAFASERNSMLAVGRHFFSMVLD